MIDAIDGGDPSDIEGEEAFEILSEGIGRRDLLRGVAGLSAAGVVSGWLGAGAALADPRRAGPFEIAYDEAPGEPGPRVLQPGQGPVRGRYVRAAPDRVLWGVLPNRDTPPILTVRSGAVLTFDTVSHEGVLEDQGRDPLQYFTSHGVPRRAVLRDAIAIAGSDIEHDFEDDGPHVVNGPVHVAGARPGDVLKVDVLRLLPRVPYGVISNRHGKGGLPGEFPEGPPSDPNATAETPELFRNVSIFTPVRSIQGRNRGVLPGGPRHVAVFPLDPFLGIMGTAPDTSERVNSVPPIPTGGNMDISDLGVGTTAYLPVAVRGAKFYVGDPHFAQGDGEVALTAWEASLRATVRLTLLKQGSDEIPGGRGTLDVAFGETDKYWIPIGLDPDLDEAMKAAIRQAIEFLHGEFGMPRAVAIAYLSAAGDFIVSQVVDRTKGVHGRINKDHFVRRRRLSRTDTNGRAPRVTG